MYLMKMDPRELVESKDHSRQTKSSPEADALLLASINAVGIIHPPIVSQQTDGGNGFLINAGRRRVRMAIKAGLEEIDIIVKESDNDNGAMRSFVENVVRDPLNPVDQWRAIERLIVLGWTEDAIATALTLHPRRVAHIRRFATVLPAMLDAMARGSTPNEKEMRTISSAPLEEQKEVWKKYKPSKDSPQVDWWRVSQALTKTRYYAKDASFGDDLAQAYGIAWENDIFGPADEDGRFTTNAEAYLGAQQEWMTANLPKKGIVTEVNTWGQPELPKKAERVYGKVSKADHVAMYLDRDGRVQTLHFRMPQEKKGKPGASDHTGEVVVSKPRPEVTRNGMNMVGDFRTDALHEALARAPIEDDTLMALLVLAFAGKNVTVTSGAREFSYYSAASLAEHAARLFNANNELAFDSDTLRIAVRSLLIDVLSCRENKSDSGIVSRVAGVAIGADDFLPNMGTEDFLSCLSRPVLEAACKDASVTPRARVKDTRAALVEHFQEGHFVHRSALFAPRDVELAAWVKQHTIVEQDNADDQVVTEESSVDPVVEGPTDEEGEGFREAA